MMRLYYFAIIWTAIGFTVVTITPTSLRAQQLSNNSDVLQIEQLIVVPMFLLVLALFIMIVKRKEKGKRSCKLSDTGPGKR